MIWKTWVNSNWTYSPETLNSGQNRWYFFSCDPEMWRVTLRNNRAHLLCCFKLCASFHSHQLIQTGVSLETPILGQNRCFLSRVTLKFDGWPWKTIRHLSWATSSFVHHFTIKCESTWCYGPETAKLGFDLCDLDLWPWPFAWTSLLSMLITPENFMMIRWWEHSQQGVQRTTTPLSP